jgi:transposase
VSKVRYPEQIKIEAVKQVTKVGFSVAEVVNRLGTTTYSLYAWIQRYGPEAESFAEFSAESSEILRLRKELKRVTEERNLLKKPRRISQASQTKIRLYPGSQCRLSYKGTV